MFSLVNIASHAVADQLQHLAAGIMDGIDRGLRVIVEERDDLAGIYALTASRSTRAGRKTTAPC